MEEVLETYEKPYDPACPVLCMDEQPVQLLKETRSERTVKCILSCGLGWRISFPRTWELHDGKIETVGKQGSVVAVVGGGTAAMRFEHSGFLSRESDLGAVVLCLAKGMAEA
jgi:hypothetical protein